MLQGASIVTIECEGYTTVILVDDEQQTEITEKLRRKIYINIHSFIYVCWPNMLKISDFDSNIKIIH